MPPSRRQKPQPPTDSSAPVTDYRHDSAKRKNIPPAGLAAQGKVAETPKLRFAYDPHLPPVLRFDPTGCSDELPELLQTAMQRPLNATEARALADALRNRQPWLEWPGKREKKACEVDPIAVHIHERVSAQVILRVAARQDVQRSLLADPDRSLAGKSSQRPARKDRVVRMPVQQRFGDFGPAEPPPQHQIRCETGFSAGPLAKLPSRRGPGREGSRRRRRPN